MRVLIAGWFSFEEMGATAGDLMCRDLLCEWLRSANYDYDVAVAPPFCDGINWETAEPDQYSHVVFVCGPFGNGWPVDGFLKRFRNCQLIGLNLTMLDRVSNWNPFDLLLERDSDTTVRPDMTFMTEPNRVPVIGVILAHRQKEYGKRGYHDRADAAVKRLLEAHEAAVVHIDTRLDTNATGLRTPAEVESLIARMDAVVTTRLHGTALSLKNGVPALVIDPIADGAKVSRQAAALGWPVTFIADSLDDDELTRAFEYCLTEDARARAAQCALSARTQLDNLKATVLDFVRARASLEKV